MIGFEAFGLSDAGRDADRNDDWFVADAQAGLFVVADGMGGRPGGDLASRQAVAGFVAGLKDLPPEQRTAEHALRGAVASANQRVRSAAAANPLLTGMGTTLSAVVFSGSNGRTVHVGDSRIYLFRRGKLIALSQDHTLVQELLRCHQITEDRALHHPLRNVLSRCIGTEEEVEPDSVEISLLPGDWLILATDGLTEALSIEQFTEILNTHSSESPEVLCRTVCAAALDNEPTDNVTVVVARLSETNGEAAA